MILPLGFIDTLIEGKILQEDQVCPRCGDPRAYVGLQKVRCANPSCRLYDPSYKPLKEKDLGFDWERAVS